MDFLNLLLMAPAQAGNTKSSGVWSIVMMVAVVIIFYLFFIRPQSKKNKELKKFRDGLKKGDKVITAGGVHGKILEVQDSTVIIETEGQGRLKVEKMSVTSIIPSEQS